MKKKVFSPVFITMFIMIPVMLVCQPTDLSLMHKQQNQTLVTPSQNDSQFLLLSNEIAISRPNVTAEKGIYNDIFVQELSGDDYPLRIVKASPGGSSPNQTDRKTIRWDNGANSDIAGITGGGIFEVAAFFPASFMIQYVGYTLDKVEIYIGDNPVSCELRIYGQGTTSLPGILLRSQSVTTTPNSWNLINLSNQLDITGQDIWISYSLDHLDETSPVGIDSGPAITGYGDMISFSGGSWSTLTSMGYSYNWNIAGYLSFICGSNISDGQGNIYNTKEIGNQCWMLENLNIGSFINSSTNQTNNGVVEKYCYNNLESWCDLYGGLYQWNEMMQYNPTDGTRGICPEGWHIPASDEWTVLIDFLGGQNTAGEPMKSIRTAPDEHPRWDSLNIATNLSLFTALPGGIYDGDGFSMLGTMGYWWSSTRNLLTPFSSYIALMNSVSNVNRCSNDTMNAFSVRCLLDNTVLSADAGEDFTICEGEDYQTIASATNYTSVFWSTSGDGVFDDPAMLMPVYTPGLFDVGTVETLCLTVQPINPDDPPVSDCMELFVQPAPIVDAGSDQTIGEGDVLTISYASASNFSEMQWYTPNGTGEFDDPNILNPVYTPSAQDYLAGSVELHLIAYGIAPCEPGEDYLVVIFIFPPSANAGGDATICATENYWLQDASATNYSSIFWESNGGDGYFITPYNLNPVYVPGPDDIATGSVELCLIAFPNGYSFFPVTDCMTLTIDLQPETCCCPDFVLNDAVEICPPEGICGWEFPAKTKNAYLNFPDMAACKDITHHYTVYPNDPMLYTYEWEISGGTPTSYTGNPVSIHWGNDNRGTIKVTITGVHCSDEIIEEICLVDGPKADFNFDPDPVCINSPVNFNNLSLGGAAYHWDFGNGEYSTAFNPPAHHYQTAGDYTITLSVSNNFYSDSIYVDIPIPCGCTDVISKTITVLDEVGPMIETNCCYGTVCPPGSSTFFTSAECDTYEWGVNGGSITSGQNTEEITVEWDAIYPGAPNSVTLELPDCFSVPCPGVATLDVPVIYDEYPITGPEKICLGSSGIFTLPVWPGTYYTWTVTPDYFSYRYQFNKQDRNVATTSISFIDAGSYEVKCVYDNPMLECGGESVFMVEVLPVLSISGYSEACQGCGSSFYANGNVDWSVSPDAGVVIDNPTSWGTYITFNNPGEYLVKAVPSDPLEFCNEFSVKSVKVVAKPQLAEIEGPIMVCPVKNNTYSITSDCEDGLFEWNIPESGTGSILSQMGANNDSIVVAWSDPNSSILEVRQLMKLKNGLTCPSDWKQIEVNAYPAPEISGVSLVCADDVITYFASGIAPPEGYNWSVAPIEKGSILSGNGTSQVSILWHGGGTATGLVTVEHCGGSASMEVVVNDPPLAEVTLDIESPSGTNHPVFCQTDIFDLLLSTADCDDCGYEWFQNEDTFNGNNNSISLSESDFANPGIYKFHVEVTRNGCTARSNIVIIEIKNCAPGCPGGCPGPGDCLAHAWFWTYQDCEKVYLINKSEPSYFIETYQWSVTPSSTATISTPNARDAELTATASGNYTIQLEITDVNGCARSFSKNVQILLPTADFTFTSPVCDGQPVFFSAIPNNPDLYDYYWTFGDDYTSNIAEPHFTFDPDNTNINLTIKDRYGCEAWLGLGIELNPVPVCEITASDTHFCPGGFVTLTASSGMASYQWYKDYEPVAGATNDQLSVYQHGEYYVETTNEYGCTCNSESIYIFMHPLPVADISGDTYVCSGNSFYLETPFKNNYTYDWSETSGETGATFTPITWHNAIVEVDLSPDVTGQYIFSVLVTDNTTECTAMDYVCVTINETPDLSFVPQTECEDNPITLSPDPNNPETYHYQWSNGQTDPEITVSTPGEYWLTISNKLTGCNATAYAATIFPKPDLSLFPYGCDAIYTDEQIEFYIPLPLNSNDWWPNTVSETYDPIHWYNDEGSLLGTGEAFTFTANSSNTGYNEISVAVKNYHNCVDTAGVFCLDVQEDCPDACENFDDGIHGFVSYNDWDDVITSPPIIVIESPGSGGYPGDLGLRVTDESGGTWIYDTVNYGGNYLACNENCLCWDMNVVYNDPSITSYHPYIYLFKGFDPQLPFSDNNPQHFAKFTSNSPTGYQEWVNTCAKIKPSPDGTEPPSSIIGEWTWSRGGMDWYDFISDIQGIMFRVDVTGWGSQQEKIRYDSICLECSPCPKDTTICCDTTLLLSTSNFTGGVFSGPFVSKVGENYEFNMGCENFPTPSPPDYESYSQDVELLYAYTDSTGYSYDCYFTITVDYKFPPPPDCPGLDTILCLNSEPFWHGIIYIDPLALGVGTHYFDCFWTNACGSWQWSSASEPPVPQVRRKVTVLDPNANGHSIPDITVCKSDQPFWHWDRWIDPGDYEYGSANVIDYTYIDPCGDTVSGSYTVYVRDWDFICNTDFIDIPEEWFIVSSYVNPFPPYPSPDPTPIIDIFEPEIYLGHFEYALGKNGILWPSGGINTIGNWDVYQGYKIKMNEPGWIELTGEIPEDKTINLDAGANFIPVLSQEFYPAMDIFGQLGEGLIFAFDLNTELLYWPQGGINSLQVLEPGKGYLVGMAQPGQATYDPLKGGVKNHTPAKPKVYQYPPWSFIRSGSPHLISVDRSALTAFAPEDFIGVFNAEGLCAGISQIDNSKNNLLLVAYGNDFTLKSTTGFARDEPMQFKVYRASEGNVSHVQVTYDASMPNMGLFAENGLSKIMKIKTVATTVDEYVQSDIQIYPNPNDGTFTIQGIKGKIDLRIFNAFGEEIYRRELILPAKVDLSTHPKGIYFIRIDVCEKMYYEKLIIN